VKEKLDNISVRHKHITDVEADMQKEIAEKLSESSSQQIQAKKGTTAVIIANPTAGSYVQNEHQIRETVSYLQQHGWKAELWLTQKAGDARRLAGEAVQQKKDVVIVVGGDGTINEVIQELANSETALGVLPSGTVNVWARETGIPLENTGAREILLHGQTRNIDLGQVGDRYFLLMAGIGVDGEITHAVEKKPVKRFGVLGYLVIGTWLGFGYPGFRIVLQVGEQTIHANAFQVIIGNTQLYGGAIKYTWEAKCDDGLLDVCVIYKRNFFGRIGMAIDFLLHREQRRQWVKYETGQDIKIHTQKPVAMQIDGDSAGNTPASDFPPITFRVIPGSLKVIVPQHVPEALFSK
jgi:diacylglycerol kinase (ATP)